MQLPPLQLQDVLVAFDPFQLGVAPGIPVALCTPQILISF